MSAGYVLYDPGYASEALRAYLSTDREVTDIRYAAVLDDGRSLIAWDGAIPIIPAGSGRIFHPMMTHDPDYPDSWPDWARPGKAAPKRAVSNGLERFALVSIDLAGAVAIDPRVTGIVQVDHELCLVETNAWDVPLAAWRATAVEIFDRRLQEVTA